MRQEIIALLQIDIFPSKERKKNYQPISIVLSKAQNKMLAKNCLL